MVDSARRRVVTDVSLSRRLASTQCFRRRRATSACSARRTLAAYLSSAVCGAVLAEPHARRPYEPSRTSSDVSWKSLRGAAQRAQHTGGRSPSVEPLDSCLCQGYPTPTTTQAHCSSSSTSPPSQCRWATRSVQTDGLVPNFESLAALTSSSRRGNPRAWANCFHILRRLPTQDRTVAHLRSASRSLSSRGSS